MATKKSVKTPKKSTGGRKRSLQNLQPPWKPGESGNPGGRPRSKHISEAYRQWLAHPSASDPEITNAYALAEVVGSAALKGDLGAVKEITDRTEGPPPKAVDLSADEQKRKMAENALDALMLETGVERDTAVKQLLDIVPEASKWIS